MKKSFLIHLDSLEILDELTDEQIAKLFKAIRSYHLGLEPKLDQILRIAFMPFKLQFERDSEKYEQTSLRNSLNGSKGGRPKKQENPVGFSGLSEKREKPLKAKKADSDNDSDNDSDSDIIKDIKRKKFIPPTYEEVEAFFLENNESLNNLPRCYHHYADANWTNSRGKKVVNWKQTIKTNWFNKNQNLTNQEVPAQSSPGTNRRFHESYKPNQ